MEKHLCIVVVRSIDLRVVETKENTHVAPCVVMTAGLVFLTEEEATGLQHMSEGKHEVVIHRAGSPKDFAWVLQGLPGMKERNNEALIESLDAAEREIKGEG